MRLQDYGIMLKLIGLDYRMDKFGSMVLLKYSSPIVVAWAHFLHWDRIINSIIIAISKKDIKIL